MSENKESGKKIAIIRIRGSIGLKQGIKDTLKMLNLHKKNYCVVVNETPSINGMINKVKDYVTWGEIDDDTAKLLAEKRGKDKGKFFRLSPPRKGFGRKGIKIPFKIGGGLGYRADKINDLIKRML